MNEQKQTKRQLISKANSTVFIAVAIAAVVVSLCGVSGRFLFQKMTYNNRVIGAKNEARNQINDNNENLKKLIEEYPALDSASTDPERILHALPDTYDYAAVASSIESLAKGSGVSLVGQPAEDETENSETESSKPQPVEISLSIEVNGSFKNINTFITHLERSIRPMNVKSIKYNGTDNALRATIEATTYYQPKRSLDAAKRTIE